MIKKKEDKINNEEAFVFYSKCTKNVKKKRFIFQTKHISLIIRIEKKCYYQIEKFL
jgi:hypothetical protein